MKKNIFAVILAAVMIIGFAVPVFANGESDYLFDEAGLLSSSEYTEISQKLYEISTRQNMDVAVVTVESTGYLSAQDYADNIQEDLYGVNSDGILLLVDMELRDWHVTTIGYGITVVTDAGLDYMSEQFVPYLSDGDYLEAFDTYAELCDEFIAQAKSGDPFDSHNLPKAPFNFFMSLLIALVVGLVVALIVTGVLRGQLKSVRSQANATDYVKQGSLEVSESRDFFLYRQVSRRPKPKNNGSSTHRSSSGTSHGGGGGSF